MKMNFFRLSIFSIIFIAVTFFVACEKDGANPVHEDSIETPDILAAPVPKIDVCHYDEDNNTWQLINISMNGWNNGHADHENDVRLDDQDGDGYVPYNECGFGNMGDCDDNDAAVNPGATEIPYNGIDDDCDPSTPDDDLDGDGFDVNADCNDNDANIYPGAEEVCGDEIDNNCDGNVDEDCGGGETILAIAYTDVDPGDGPGFNGAIDVLIAKWVDGGSAGVGPGDVVVTNKYPLDDDGLNYNDPSSFGSFTVQSHTIIEIKTKDQPSGTLTGKDAAGSEFTFWVKPSGSNPLGTERYMENLGGNNSILTLFQDGVVAGSPNIISANANTPSQPDQSFPNKGGTLGTDDAFIDVVIDPSVW